MTKQAVMNRRKTTKPWIQRWSRPLMAGIAAIGAVVTAYLTVTKLMGSSTACPVNGCNIVLSSPYATVFGLPLALFGFLAYSGMIGLAVAPLLVKPSREAILSETATRRRSTDDPLEAWTGLLLFVGATAMMVFSGYLMYLLAFKIQTVCLYCVGSALMSTSLFVLSILGRKWEGIGQLLSTGVIVSMVVLVGTLAVYAPIDNPAIAERQAQRAAGISGNPITTTSGESELALAEHLTQSGATMYAAYWCPHCFNQKQLFGKEAVSRLNYVECAEDGKGAQPGLCKAEGVQGYPTWKINGQALPIGAKTLQELADVSGYQGPRNFQNPVPADL